MHDLGTFCFSHTTESAYISFGETTHARGGKGLDDDHENLGSFIIKNTDYDGGITRILKKHEIDPQEISDLVKGVSPSVLANQILHSEVDCDRMDYLLRDAHYTGLNYGTYDRDYLLHHFRAEKVDGKEILTIRENALHSVEDFLMARFAWYSQVIRSPRGAKFDALAADICFYLLEKNLIYRYSDLLDIIENDPVRFFQFNDNFFIETLLNNYTQGTFNKNKKIKSMVEALILRKNIPQFVNCEEFKMKLLNQDDPRNEKIAQKTKQKIEEIKSCLTKHGAPEDWLLIDLPQKDIIFMQSKGRIVKRIKGQNVLLERDPVKISCEDGNIRLLVDMETSIMTKLQHSVNYIPNVFCSPSAYLLLQQHKIIE